MSDQKEKRNEERSSHCRACPTGDPTSTGSRPPQPSSPSRKQPASSQGLPSNATPTDSLACSTKTVGPPDTRPTQTAKLRQQPCGTPQARKCAGEQYKSPKLLRRTARKETKHKRPAESAALNLSGPPGGLELAARLRAPRLKLEPKTETGFRSLSVLQGETPTKESSNSRVFSTASLPAGDEAGLGPRFRSLDDHFQHFYGRPPDAGSDPSGEPRPEIGQSLLNMRTNFIDWAILVFNNMIECFGDNSFFRCVHIFDLFLARRAQALASCPRLWPGVWASCFVLACKFEEYWDFKPEEIEKTFGVEPIGAIEWQIAECLEFKLADPTPDDWIGWYVQTMFSGKESLFGADGKEKTIMRYCCTLVYKKLLLSNEISMFERPKDISIICLYVCIEQLEAIYANGGLELTPQKQQQLAAAFEAVAKQGLTMAHNLRLKELLSKSQHFLEVGFYKLEPHLTFRGLRSLLPFEEYFSRQVRRPARVETEVR